MDHKQDDYIEHYASPYYDPVKAHEYYMNHRKLKGRRSAAKLNDEGKEAWSYTKEQITQQKKQEKLDAQTKKNEKIKAYQQRVAETLKKLQKRLAELNAKIARQNKLISGKDKYESKEDREARISRQMAERENLRTEASGVRETQQHLRDDLKAQCEKFRESYKSQREELDAKYEKIYQQEYDKILSEYEKPVKRRISS